MSDASVFTFERLDRSDILRIFLTCRKKINCNIKVLRTSTEDLAASIATAGELGVVAITAVDLVHLTTELFVHQGHSAPVAEEAGLMPVLILVRQILKTTLNYVNQFQFIFTFYFYFILFYFILFYLL